MKLNSLHLQAFKTLCQERSFTRASKLLGLSQPAFSHRIKSLEDELELTLFIRDKKGILLTPEGEQLLSYAKKLEALEGDFLDQFQGDGISGVLRIGGFSSVMRSLVLPAIAPLLKKNPRLKLKTFTLELSELHSHLKSSQLDMILTTRPIENKSFESTLLGYEENVMVGLKNYEELSQGAEIYLDHDEEDQTTNEYFSLLGIKPPHQKLFLDDVYGLIDGVILGLGKAILPKHLIKKHSKAIKIFRPKTILKVPVYLCYPKAPYYPEGQRKCLEVLEKELKKSL